MMIFNIFYPNMYQNTHKQYFISTNLYTGLKLATAAKKKTQTSMYKFSITKGIWVVYFRDFNQNTQGKDTVVKSR